MIEMLDRNFSKDKKVLSPKKEIEKEAYLPIKDLSKDEINGKRNPKKNKKDYDRKYSDAYDQWN